MDHYPFLIPEAIKKELDPVGLANKQSDCLMNLRQKAMQRGHTDQTGDELPEVRV